MNLGQLRGVGAVADLIRTCTGKWSWSGKAPACRRALRAFGAECQVVGSTVRAVLAEENQDAAIEALRRDRRRLVSVIPVRRSLEDYFVAQVKPAQPSAGVTA